jgi:hypothetical protein
MDGQNICMVCTTAMAAVVIGGCTEFVRLLHNNEIESAMIQLYINFAVQNWRGFFPVRINF